MSYSARLKSRANDILDMVREGATDISTARINWALRVLGDIPTMRGAR